MFGAFKSGDENPAFAKGPGAMEKMVASMLGFTPEEMAANLSQLRDTIVAVGAALNRIEAKLDLVLEGRVIDNGDGSNGNGDRNSGGGAGSGGGGTRPELPAPGDGTE